MESLEDFSAQVAAAAALAADQSSSAAAPPATTVGVPGEVVTTPTDTGQGMTLEEQAAAQEAANIATTETPNPGSDIPLPAELGEAFAGKNVADLIGMLSNAQRKITELGQAKGPDGTLVPGTGANTPPKTLEQTVADAKMTPAEKTQATLTHYANVFNQQGSLSEADVTAIEKSTGLPSHMVTSWIQGEAAKAQLAAQEIYGVVGGEQKYTEMLGWMEKNVPNAQLEQFNRALATDNLPEIKFAVEAMHGAWKGSGGGAPTFFSGPTPATTAAEPFASWPQVSEAMSDPRYETDAAYRTQVESRLAVSNI